MRCAHGKLLSLFMASALLGCAGTTTQKERGSTRNESPSVVRPPSTPRLATKAELPTKKESGNPDLANEEQELVKLINDARAKEGAPALRASAALVEAARAQATKMVETNKADGTDLQAVKGKIEAGGYMARNLSASAGMSSQPNAKAMFDLWMKDAGSRGFMMNKDFEDIGIAIVRNPAGTAYFFSQILATARKM
ncbi:MAG: CAP domain-containing protein [Gemmataceae bacterium]|nr:CAP domain-containing protein [Gemmataceae bacterium]